MPETPGRRPLPQDPLEHRQDAEQALGALHASERRGVGYAAAVALLAIAGELHEIRKQLRKR